MIKRIAFIGAVALLFSASAASAQGKTQPVVLSKAVVKSMTSNKPKTKIPLGATIGIGKKPTVAVKQTSQAAPTSVREIAPIAKK